MAVHSNGLGAGWLETLDVDQPHGLDYREFNDFRIGVRNRLKQEHSEFADTTAGGIHKPGGVAVLGMEINTGLTESTEEIVPDGTYRARGLIWEYHDSSNRGRLWCATANAGVSTTGDWTIMLLHPNLQWGGGDITWKGAQEFDATVDFSQDVAFGADCTIHIAGDLTSSGKWYQDGTTTFRSAMDVSIVKCDGTVDFSKHTSFITSFCVGTTADISKLTVDGSTVIKGDSSFTGEMHGNQIVHAWANYDGVAGTLLDNYGTASVTRHDPGIYTITWDTPFAGTNYVVVATCGTADGGIAYYMRAHCYSQKAGEIGLQVTNPAAQFDDSTYICVMAIGVV